MLLMIPFVLLFFSGCTDDRADEAVTEDPTETVELRGNTTGNLVNWGLATKQDEWIYFSHEDDNGYIYKKNQALSLLTYYRKVISGPLGSFVAYATSCSGTAVTFSASG